MTFHNTTIFLYKFYFFSTIKAIAYQSPEVIAACRETSTVDTSQQYKTFQLTFVLESQYPATGQWISGIQLSGKLPYPVHLMDI